MSAGTGTQFLVEGVGPSRFFCGLRENPPGLYWWVRDLDETGMSGAGRVAQVAVFGDGSAVMRWMADLNSARVSSSVFYDSIAHLVHVHGHSEKRTGHLERVE